MPAKIAEVSGAEIAGVRLLRAAHRVTHSCEAQHQCPRHPFRLLFDGQLRKSWVTAREAAVAANPYRASSQVRAEAAAGRRVIAAWAVRNWFVSGDNSPLKCLVDLIDTTYRSQSAAPAKVRRRGDEAHGYFLSDDDLPQPDETNAQAGKRIRRLIDGPRRTKDGQKTKRKPVAPRNRMMDYAAEAWVLRVSGVGTAEILARYKPLPGCEWRTAIAVTQAIARIDKQVGLRSRIRFSKITYKDYPPEVPKATTNYLL